jgi:very-short-patch-repair endonuclease
VLQKTYLADGRTIARVDAEFPGGLIVEVAGHGTHATRRQRQRDTERHTELTLRGKRVLTFTYEDVRDRPGWVVDRLRRGLSRAA